MREKESHFIPPVHDFTNEDTLTQLLESGTSEELEEVRKFHDLTHEQIELFSQNAKLRKQTHEQMRLQLQERKEHNPTPTQEELSMGCYKEALEPQVRSVISKLRSKGYTTYESGFHGFERQIISFEEKHLENFQLPENLIRELEHKGIKVKIKPNSITFKHSRFLGLDDLEKVWTQIGDALPDLQKPAEPRKINSARFFREGLKK